MARPKCNNFDTIIPTCIAGNVLIKTIRTCAVKDVNDCTHLVAHTHTHTMLLHISLTKMLYIHFWCWYQYEFTTILTQCGPNVQQPYECHCICQLKPDDLHLWSASVRLTSGSSPAISIVSKISTKTLHITWCYPSKYTFVLIHGLEFLILSFHRRWTVIVVGISSKLLWSIFHSYVIYVKRDIFNIVLLRQKKYYMFFFINPFRGVVNSKAFEGLDFHIAMPLQKWLCST